MAFQGLFKRSDTHVAVRPIRLSSKTTLMPGVEIDMKEHGIRGFQRRILFMRRRIGIAGSQWAKEMLADLNNAHARPEIKVETDATEESPEKQSDEQKPQKKGKKPRKKQDPIDTAV